MLRCDRKQLSSETKEKKKSDPKEYILYYCIYMKCPQKVKFIQRESVLTFA